MFGILLDASAQHAGRRGREALAVSARTMGVPTQLLSADEAARLSPGVVTDDVLGATFHPRDGYCSPESVVQGYAKAARELGATIRTGIEVTGIERSGINDLGD